MIANGLPASPGAAVGQVVFCAEDAEAWHAQGKSAILVFPHLTLYYLCLYELSMIYFLLYCPVEGEGSVCREVTQTKTLFIDIFSSTIYRYNIRVSAY